MTTPYFPSPDLPAPDPEAIATFLNVIFDYTTGYVPVRLLTEKGQPSDAPWSAFPPVDDRLATVIAGEAVRAANTRRGVFVVPGTVARPGSAKAADIIETGVLLIDIDEGDITVKRHHLCQYLGPPTLEVASGGRTAEGQEKRHLYWRLSELAAGKDLAPVCALRAEIARKVGGDPAFASPHQPIRVAGTIHNKHGQANPVRILSHQPQEYHIDDLVQAVEEMPPLPGLGIKSGTVALSANRGPSVQSLMTKIIHEGGSNETTRFTALSKAIGHWIRQVRMHNASLDQAWTAVREQNAATIVPPWDEGRLRRDFEALLSRDIVVNGPMPGAAEPRAASNRIAPALSEDALAQAFVREHGADWHHVPIWGTWLRWSGTHWKKDDLGGPREAIRLICRATVTDHDKPHEARRIASDRTITAVQRIAASDPIVAAGPDIWDRHAFLLNTPEGTLDLASGEVREHRRTDLMTLITGASVGADCRRWIGFVEEIMGGDNEMVAYLARVCGYCLTGSMTEQVFFFLHGEGANGKSVFLRALSTVLGSYAKTAPLESFTATTGDRHPTDLAGLRGARLVTVTETEAGRTWAESRIKAITGGDPIRARLMHRDFFEFAPSFKLIVSGNHRPQLKAVGEAMRRRLHLIPFAVIIPEDRRDRTIDETLAAERDGILAWMIAGCLEWQRIGLAPPEAVRLASAEYFADEDHVGQWIAEHCELGAALVSTSAALYASWSAFAETSGLEKGSQRTLAEALRQRGITPERVEQRRCWRGIALRHRGASGA